jgi:hypothetical protein
MSTYHEIDIRGKHWLQIVPDKDLESHTSADKGRIFYSNDDEKVYYGNSTQWVNLPSTYDTIPQNTRFLMGSWPLPTGWNIVNSYNTRVVLFADTEAELGTTAGSWTISGISEAAKHYHGNKTGRPTLTAALGKSEIKGNAASSTHRHNISKDGDHFHTFDGTWRPVHTHYVVANYT